MSSARPRMLLSNWPVIVAFGLVTLLVVVMIGLDVHFSQKEAQTTSEILENTQLSIMLLENLRSNSKRLMAARTADEVRRWAQAIATDERRFAPLATYPGEHEQWQTLQALLAKLPDAPVSDATALRPLADQIDAVVDELVSLNNEEGRGHLLGIRAAHVQAIWSDIGAGAVVLATVALVSGWLLRMLERQRRLVLREVELLDEKNAELEAFAGRAAHDLRSPMGPIRGYADLILEVPGIPEAVVGMVEKIRRAVERTTRVIDDMLALSVSGRVPEGHCSSTEAIRHVLDEMDGELKHLELSTRLAGGQVACPEGTLSQVLRNLIGNAIKFRATSRPPRLAIETRDVDSMVELSVEDNGLGMDREGARHAFEPFYRGSAHRAVPGHGLGLAIVQRTVRAVGGSCELTSAPDEGTRVRVLIPRG